MFVTNFRAKFFCLLRKNTLNFRLFRQRQTLATVKENKTTERRKEKERERDGFGIE